jgi:hypothetical protein
VCVCKRLFVVICDYIYNTLLFISNIYLYFNINLDTILYQHFFFFIKKKSHFRCFIILSAQPSIIALTSHQTVVEGSHLTVVCTVSGSEPLNITLSKSDGTHKTQGNILTVPVVNRNDEGDYVCTVNNGDECLVVSATTSATVNCKYVRVEHRIRLQIKR